LGHQGAQRLFVRVVGRRNGGLFQQRSQIADFFMRLRKQVGDLAFQRAGVDDFPERSVGGERQQIARDVESAGAQSALVCLRLHFGGTRGDADEIFERSLRNFFVGCEQGLDGFAIQSPGRSARGGTVFREIVILESRRIVTALPEVLIAGRTLLAIPALLVGNNNGGEYGE